MAKVKYLFYVGDRFGKWVVISEVQIKKQHRTHLCRCVCGFESNVSCTNLGTGKSTQCHRCASQHRARNTMIKNSLVGNRFGKLLVLERVPKKYRAHTYYWLCRCDCGIESKICHSNLVSGKATHCGCSRPIGNRHGCWKGHGEISQSRWKSIVAAAASRNIDLGITIQDAWDLFLKQQRKCSLTGWELVMHVPRKIYGTASLDRIDSSLGYISGNIQWVHKHINQMKSDHNQEDFLRLCQAVANGPMSNNTIDKRIL